MRHKEGKAARAGVRVFAAVFAALPVAVQRVRDRFQELPVRDGGARDRVHFRR
jgi:hypothetical protein